MGVLQLARNAVILDGTCAINLYASGHFREICVSVGQQCFVTQHARQKEATRIFSRPVTSLQDVPEQLIDWDEIDREGFLVTAESSSDDEGHTWLNYISMGIDEGPALTASIAYHRDWVMATDDKQVLSRLTEFLPGLPVITTLDLLRHWDAVTSLGLNDLRQALESIRIGAYYQPSSTHHLYDWWTSTLNNSNTEL